MALLVWRPRPIPDFGRTAGLAAGAIAELWLTKLWGRLSPVVPCSGPIVLRRGVEAREPGKRDAEPLLAV